MPLDTNDFEFVRKLVRDRAAIVLEDGKEYLVESRLGALARKEGFGSHAALIEALRTRVTEGLHDKAIEAMTTNETHFFRDENPFEVLRNHVLPDMIRRRAAERKLNIWSAASSSGQEPYSIAITIREHFPELAGWDVRIIASDISNEMIERTRAGRYNRMEISRGLPAPLLAKYFREVGGEWEARDDLRRMLELHKVNLAGMWHQFPAMDVIFIRNVLIYFDVETKRTILGKARALLRPDGYLFLGGAETTLNLDDSFDRLPFERAGCYQLRSHICAAA